EKTLKQDLVLKGKIINSGHELPKSNVKLMLEGSVIQEMRTDTGGNFVMNIKRDKNYSIVGSKEGFTDRIISFSTIGKQTEESMEILIDMSGEGGFVSSVKPDTIKKKNVAVNQIKPEEKKPVQNDVVKSVNRNIIAENINKNVNKNKPAEESIVKAEVPVKRKSSDLVKTEKESHNVKTAVSKPEPVIAGAEIIFKVQVGASKVSLPKDYYREIETKIPGTKITETKSEENIYKYTVGNYSDLNKGLSMQNEIIKKGHDAYLVAFKDGRQITITEAMKFYNGKDKGSRGKYYNEIRENRSPKSNETGVAPENPFSETPHADGLVYRVQVGAFNSPTEDVYAYLKNVQKLFSEYKITYFKAGGDGLMKFTMGNFTEINSAISLISMLQAQGIPAFVVAYRDGVRVY
ncbi:MAG: SPOR domain-containing protein, partial [Bacteroidota bacterium]|nr:SPOR domain-containing protein [Bacteroidota bacterium]